MKITINAKTNQAICDQLASIINEQLSEAEGKIWHGHPVWFLEGNPRVDYSKQQKGLRLMFWSVADFEEPDLNIRGHNIKDASIFYQTGTDINTESLKR